MGGQSSRRPGSGQGGLEGFRPEARPLEMGRGVNLGRTLERGAELAGAGVQSPSGRRRNASVERVTQELVAIVEEPVGAGRFEERPVNEFHQGSIERRQRQIHDARKDFWHEAPADDGAGLRNGLGLGR